MGPLHHDEAMRQEHLTGAGIDFTLQSTSVAASYGAGPKEAEWGARALNDGLAETMQAFPDAVSGLAPIPFS